MIFKLFIILKYFKGSDDGFISTSLQYTGDKFSIVAHDNNITNTILSIKQNER